MNLKHKLLIELWLFIGGILSAVGLAFLAAWLLVDANAIIAGAGLTGTEEITYVPHPVLDVWLRIAIFVFEIWVVVMSVIVLRRLHRRFRWRIGGPTLTVTSALCITMLFVGIGAACRKLAFDRWTYLYQTVSNAERISQFEQEFGRSVYYYPVVDDNNIDRVMSEANFSDRKFAKGKEVFFFDMSLPFYWIVVWCEGGKIVKKTWSPM